MTVIKPGTRLTIDIWSGKPVTIEYKDWGDKSLDFFVFTPKAMAPSYRQVGAKKGPEGKVKIYILQSEYREWFGMNSGGDRDITVTDKWFNPTGWDVISPGTPDKMYSSRFLWQTRAEWDKSYKESYPGRLRDSVMEKKLSDCRCNDENVSVD